MTSRVWLGGGNNRASNPNDWSPNGKPQPGDTLTMNNGTMDISGLDLASPMIGGLLVDGDATLNLHDALVGSVVTIEPPPFPSGGAGLPTDAVQINLKGIDVLNFQVNTGLGISPVTVDLAPFSVWIGGFTTDQFHFGEANVTVNGGLGATFINTGSEIQYTGGSSVLNVNVAGRGEFSVTNDATLTFGGLVGPGQTVDLLSQQASGFTTIDKPNEFFGTVQLDAGLANLVGLASADSYTFTNDLLAIYHGKSVIDVLRLADSSPFYIDKTPTGITVSSFDPGQGVPLPIHH